MKKTLRRIALTGALAGLLVGCEANSEDILGPERIALSARVTGKGPAGKGNGAFDEFGYNYQANMFNGRYCDADRVIGGGPYCDVGLQMKWSDEWLNEDRVRCAGTPQEGSSACEGSWLTNHQSGTNPDGKKWTYFVKIVYPSGGVVDANNDGFDDNTGGEIIWGSYVRIQQVSNDPSVPEHGIQALVNPAGFGAHK